MQKNLPSFSNILQVKFAKVTQYYFLEPQPKFQFSRVKQEEVEPDKKYLSEIFWEGIIVPIFWRFVS